MSPLHERDGRDICAEQSAAAEDRADQRTANAAVAVKGRMDRLDAMRKAIDLGAILVLAAVAESGASQAGVGHVQALDTR